MPQEAMTPCGAAFQKLHDNLEWRDNTISTVADNLRVDIVDRTGLIT